ncbi:hypothetical protein F5Y15DRAFT_398140 [Xylariaceae sp. FL0016]|nr:hypothetical protein F5Y15DRAFT_398140 [Xylariaceae sp. FL0016]
MEGMVKRGFPKWTQTPIPGFELSPAGLIALADLGTIAQRTRIAGGSSWLDALLLAPGLHYQQAADALQDSTSSYSAVELFEGKSSTYGIANSATLNYLHRVGQTGQKVIVDVGMMPERSFSWVNKRISSGKQRAVIWQDQGADLGWLSHILYLASPVLTVLAFVFMILLREWWGVGLLLALMFSRVLNIWVIKQRTKPPSQPPSSNTVIAGEVTEYVVDLGDGRIVHLRGLAEDLQAITTSSWLSAKTPIDGYLEAMAKLTVFLVAAFSGNMTQAGSIIFLVLLLVTAGLLGLSNAHAKTLRMHGRLAAPTTDHLPRTDSGKAPPGTAPYPDSRQGSTSWPADEDMTSSGYLGMDDFAEKGQVGGRVRDRHPFDEPTHFS